MQSYIQKLIVPCSKKFDPTITRLLDDLDKKGDPIFMQIDRFSRSLLWSWAPEIAVSMSIVESSERCFPVCNSIPRTRCLVANLGAMF